MIIPSGTEIEVDAHGQLSIRTPGNLVIQNSGSYGTIESRQGSIRIEPDVQVEAVNIRCAKVCYVQGSLTAWKVQAQSIELEESARAHIILQETDSLQIGREARLVGNFSSEKELFLLFSRFAEQMRSMPFGFSRRSEIEQASRPRLESVTDERQPRQKALGGGSNGRPDQLPDELFFAQVLLEREAEKAGGGPTYRRVVEQLLTHLRAGDVEALRRDHAELFSQVSHSSDDFSRARQLVSEHFASVA
ncbi:MAG: hypothetical protein DWQ36_17160 [Acidobacteria bacterium]|nr:MAG: hypothetical protein DWQ30_05255 [Acidobacteriota bacterium]REK04578.1 MAG: hypothetical protein DWQ36_17160 [Acidobacteriota bacterium]